MVSENEKVIETSPVIPTTEPIALKEFNGSFRENKTAFGKIHEFLIKHKIIDGSSDSLLQDILDGTKTDDVAIDLIVKRIGNSNISDIVEKLVYLALSGFFRWEIVTRIKAYLRKHLKACNEANIKQDYAFMKTLVVDGATISDVNLRIALTSRINALKEVLSLHGEHFLKRSIFVSPGFLINMSNR